MTQFPILLPQPPEQDSFAAIRGWAARLTESLTKQFQQRQKLRSKTLTYAGTIEVSPDTADVFSLAATGACTINLTSARTVGDLTFIISNDATPRVITFGTGFTSSGTLTGTANKTAVVKFVSNSLAFYEVSRKENL